MKESSCKLATHNENHSVCVRPHSVCKTICDMYGCSCAAVCTNTSHTVQCAVASCKAVPALQALKCTSQPIMLSHCYRCCPCIYVCLRYGRSGTMHGLFRVRGFTQDDAHIFCWPDQIATEIKSVLDLSEVSTFPASLSSWLRGL